MQKLTSKEIKPRGWLKRQLEIQAAGLSGNLDKIWPDIRDSRWIGGDMDGWERVPYWLDGFIPLAYLLEDGDLISRAKRYIDAILARQNEDGWLCPCSESERANYDTWALFLILKVLIVYHDCSGDERIEEAVYRALKQYSVFIRYNTVKNWASARWFECLVSVSWLYERRREDWLVELAKILHMSGIDYAKASQLWKTPNKEWSFYTHVVNIAMAIKGEELYKDLLKKCGEIDSYDDSVAEFLFNTVTKYNGTAVGHFTGDECLSGLSPIQGTELCGVVEAMYSYETLAALTGKTVWADRLEKLAFNALPATISPDMWTHQYDQMVNQIECSKMEPPVFGTNGPESHLFGLEPNFGCCTANFSQGWPKFALSSFMKEGDDIVSVSPVPAKVETSVGGNLISVELVTDYPFKGGLKYVVTAQKETQFTLKVRIPAWVKAVTVDGKTAVPKDGYVSVKKVWKAEEAVNIDFEFLGELKATENGLHYLQRGALVYSVPIKERWEKREYTLNGIERKFPYCDYEIFPESKWNYAFTGKDFEVVENDISEYPFSSDLPPVQLTLSLAEIDWGYKDGYKNVCAEKPKITTPVSPPQKVLLQPYACTRLRITELPRAT